jgi:2',3'-cyclic-nucleotide 2'-phosphodiesterase (5'-nucleotidase family)
LDTEMILDSLGILYTGPKGKSAIIERNGFKIGVLGYSPNLGTNDILAIEQAVKDVQTLDELVDIVVVTFHGGAEGEKYINVASGMEKYLGEERGDLRQFTHKVIDAGADIVFGHGPHVPRAMEIYNDRLIAYSLGNFCTYQGISVNGKGGLAPLLWVEIDATGKVTDLTIHSFSQKTKHYPVLDTTNEAGLLMQNLSAIDFPAVHPLILNAVK